VGVVWVNGGPASVETGKLVADAVVARLRVDYNQIIGHCPIVIAGVNWPSDALLATPVHTDMDLASGSLFQTRVWIEYKARGVKASVLPEGEIIELELLEHPHYTFALPIVVSGV
jgi:hypothetical protein